MVDTHAHAPQFVNAGNGLDMPLLQWLETYTFPAETRFKDADYAKKSTCVCGVCGDVCVCVCVCCVLTFMARAAGRSLHGGGASLARTGHHDHQLLWHHPRARHQSPRRY
jgi:hypothetical protein